jgi:hypothetical protein
MRSYKVREEEKRENSLCGPAPRGQSGIPVVLEPGGGGVLLPEEARSKQLVPLLVEGVPGAEGRVQLPASVWMGVGVKNKGGKPLE